MSEKPPNDGRRARWNAAKRAALPAEICPVCMARPRAVKVMLGTGEPRTLARCQPCGVLHAAGAARRRARVVKSRPRVATLRAKKATPL